MGWLANLSIRFKILTIVICALLGLGTNLGFSYTSTNSNAKRLQDVRDNYFPTLERLDANIVRLDKIKEGLNDAASTAEIDMIDDANDIADELRNTFTEIIQLDVSVKTNISQMQANFESYYTAATNLTAGMINNTIAPEQFKPRIENMTSSLATFSESLTKFRTASYNRFTKTIIDANDASQSTLEISIIIALICITVVALVGYLIGSVLEKNINNVVENLTEIASGDADLTKRLKHQSNDEIGDLVDAFNSFVDNLHHIIREVAGSIAQLAAAAEEMSMVSAESNTSVTEQQAETEQVASAMNQMTATVQEVSRNATQAAKSASQASIEANTGRQVVEITMTAISELATDVESAATVIQKLESDSENIGGVLDVIRGISEQTNLLALNAAIEAARAGEQGRGFAVVADEVRTLANRTQESTLDIKKMIESLQTGAAQAVSVMESGKQQAQTSVEQASKAGDSLMAITDSINTISDMNTQIATAAEQQSAVAEIINRNINNISRLGDQTSDGAKQTATASTEMSQLSAQLESIVGHFKI